jgi:hypothetical protein
MDIHKPKPWRGVRGRLRGCTGLAVLGLVTVTPRAPRAPDEEIQVYMDEIGQVGVLSLDVHTNFVPQGRDTSGYPGEQLSDGRIRITPEWGYAITPALELGAYLPLTTIDRDGHFEIGGVKGRLKYVAPRPQGQAWFWGLNLEIGNVRKDLDINPWNGELKGILGMRKGPWTVAGNLNIGFVVSGPHHSDPDIGIATKVSYSLDETTSIGIENYNALGSTSEFGPLARNDQEVFAVVDKGFGRWDLNVGVGYGYGAYEDRWILKAIVGVPLGE